MLIITNMTVIDNTDIPSINFMFGFVKEGYATQK